MTSLATTQDLEDIWRLSTGGPETALWQRLLDKASALLRVKVPDIDLQISDGGLDPLVVATVVAQVVKRYVVNPDGVSTTAETVGPYSKSSSFVDRYEGSDGSASIRGGLQVTKSDLDALRPNVTGASIGTIRVRSGMAPVLDRNGAAGLPAELFGVDINQFRTGTP